MLLVWNPGRWLPLVLALAAVAALCAACGSPDEPGTDAEKGIPAADEALEGASTDGLPTLLDLGSDSCVPCKAMAPILEEMRETFEGRLNVVFVDVWKDRDAARRYAVKVIPTQIFLDADGNELFRHQGFFSREDMLAKWRELGYEFDA